MPVSLALQSFSQLQCMLFLLNGLLLPLQHVLQGCYEAVAVWLVKEGETVCDGSC
jgi:hypothetical protein